MTRRLLKSADEEYRRWIAEGRVDRTGHYGTDSDPELIAAPVDAETSAPREIMDEAVEHLQGRQARIYTLVMRCGLSLAEAATEVSITKASAQVYLRRALKFVTGYCLEAINRGRV